MTTGSARELPHRFNRYAAPQGEKRAALATRGDRKWLECAKGGQPEKVSGGGGGDGFASVDAGITTVGGPLAVVGPEPTILGSMRWGGAGVGVAGAVEELAEVSVVREPG